MLAGFMGARVSRIICLLVSWFRGWSHVFYLVLRRVLHFFSCNGAAALLTDGTALASDPPLHVELINGRCCTGYGLTGLMDGAAYARDLMHPDTAGGSHFRCF